MAVDISIVDSSMDEIGAPSSFVAPGSGGLSAPKDTVIGPDGALYVASAGTNSIVRYNSSTGQLIGTFVTANSGGLVSPYGLDFGPDGNLYVSGGAATNSIKRYNGSTGAFLDTYVSTGSGGLDNPTGIVFGTDGNLYVSNKLTSSVLRFQGPLGSLPGSPSPSIGQVGATFVPAGSGGLDSPFELEFGPNGNLYVTSTFTKKGVLQFNGMDGSFVSETVSPGEGGLGEPRGLAFDQDGRLYVADVANSLIHRYDTEGQFIDSPVGLASSDLKAPLGMTMNAEGVLLIGSRDTHAIVRYDRGVVLRLSAASITPVSVAYATTDGTAFAGLDYSAQSGNVTFGIGQTTRRLLLVPRDDVWVENSESFEVQLQNATSGAIIVDSNASMNILDDDSNRGISISDALATEGDQSPHYRGAFVAGVPSGHFNPLTFGPDGNLYTAVGTGAGYNTIQRFDGTSGLFIDTFMKNDNVTHPINGVRDIVFRNEYVYVASAYTNEVLRYDATTGAFVDVFVSAGAGGIQHPDGMFFGPDSNGDDIPELYVTGWTSHNVVRFNGATGQPLGTFISTGSGGLSYPFAMSQRGTELFVTSAGTNQILKYNINSGAYLGVGATGNGLDYPRGLTFGPDDLMYVSSGNNDRIMRFTPSGTFVGDYVSAGTGGLDNPRSLKFRGTDLFVTTTGNSEIMRFGAAPESIFTVSLSIPSQLPVTVQFNTNNGTAISGNDFVASAGNITFQPGQTSRVILVPILNDSAAESTENFSVVLSSPAGGFVLDGSAIATIIDDELPPTKFYVVNDGTPDRTYEYGASGTAIENYSIQTTNTSPRGAASNATGDKVWVVDANKKVYVYNTSGGMLGSWSAGTLPNNATVEGITTHGPDIWIVDSKSDKVYKYAGAASRLSGSQTAASSFSLNGSNTSPTDLVTDGSSIWVLNNTILADKVFKYSISGSLLGNWTITSGGGSPTGITIDPTNVSNIWIVDNNSDRVYQFDTATSRTSGSASPNSSFALSAGNTNPQGIADPPPVASNQLSVAADLSVPELDKRNRKSLAEGDQFIAQIDSIFENWNEDGLSRKTNKRMNGRR